MEIYVAHSRVFDFKKDLYEPIRNSSLNDQHNFVLPHEHSSLPFDSKNYLQNTCNLLVAEISGSSTGLGIELGWADAYKIPIILVYQKGISVASYFDNISIKTVVYSDDKELIFGLEAAINSLN